MNKQDAIKCLKSIQQWVPDCDDREDGLSYWDAIDMAIDALDPPNEPLTLEQLREMDGEPVWVDDKKTWALLQVWDDKNIDVVFPMPKGCFHAKSVNGRKIYRRPPEVKT